MIAPLLTHLLPLISQFGLWWVNWFFKDQDVRADARETFELLIKLHQQSGVKSAEQRQSYRDQVEQLQRSVAEKKSES